jgi:hypothetical protein
VNGTAPKGHEGVLEYGEFAMKQAWFLASTAVLLACGPASADDQGKRCTKTSVSCYDAKEKKARTCVTETCTYADGRTTTSVTVELQQGGKKIVRQVEAGRVVNIGNKSVMSVTPMTKTPSTKTPGLQKQ